MSEHKFKVGDRVKSIKWNDCVGKATKLRAGTFHFESDNHFEYNSGWREYDEFELIEPTAPFTRAEIDALIDAYPECNTLIFSEKVRQLTWIKDYPSHWNGHKKKYNHNGREIGFEWNTPVKDNQIQPAIKYDSITTWTKGEPLPGEKNAIPVASDVDRSVIECVVSNLRTQNPNVDINYANGEITISQQLWGTAGQVTVDLLSDEQPQTQTTCTFSAELPSGEVVEMPAPDGDGWTVVEREEFKRGDCWASVKPKDDECDCDDDDDCDCDFNLDSDFFASTIDTDYGLDFLTDPQKCWFAEYYKMGSFEITRPILSITTWRREVAPEPPGEEPYDYHCASKQPLRGRWPERSSEVE